jgi:hypothetical protein
MNLREKVKSTESALLVIESPEECGDEEDHRSQLGAVH